MAEPFDPYWKWLGIPPKHQPPNAYRLLGIELFEYDPDVIDNAADQRMGHLKNFGAGEYAELSERILNEIASARIRLLNPERKAEYDAQLRQRTGRQPMIPPNIPHDSEPRQEQPTDVGTVTARPDPIISIDVGDDNQTPTARRHGRNGRRPAWQVPVTIGGGACLVTVVLSILLFAGKNGVEDPGPTGLPQVAKPSGKGDTSGQQGVGAQPPTPDPDETTPDGSPTAGSESDDGPSDEEPPRDDPPAEVEPNGTAPAQRPEPTPDPPSPGSEADEQERQPSVVRPVPAFPRRSAVLMPPTPPPRVRLPEPGERARRAAEKEIRGVYEQKISEATTPRLKKALAAKYGRDASRSKEPAVIRFTLLDMACTLAAEEQDLDQALVFADRLDQAFQIDVHKRRAKLLEDAEDAAKNKKKSSRTGVSFADQKIVVTARELSRQAVRAEKMGAAERLLSTALSAARRMDDGCLAASLSSEIDRIKSLKRRITRVEEARKALAADANDAKANLTVGSWECFVMENWEEGLPYLTKAAGSAEVAKLDLTNPDETDALARIGDGWWKLSESKKGDERQHLRARAKLRYKQALQDATGFARAKLKKRLFAKGILHHALQFDGQTSRVEVQDFGYGGSRPLTIEAVVQPQRAAPQAGRSSRQTIFSNGLSAGLRLEISHGWNFRFWYQKSPRKWSLTSVSSQRRVDYDHWTHVAAVYDPQTNQIRLYVNGQPQTPRTVSGPHRPSNSPFYIGAAPSARGRSPAYYFRGMVRSLRVSSSARYTPLVEAPDELEADRSTVLLFKFDEGKGDHLKNSAGGKVVGRILNCKWVETE